MNRRVDRAFAVPNSLSPISLGQPRGRGAVEKDRYGGFDREFRGRGEAFRLLIWDAGVD